jgi:hypothetical protein
LIVGKRAVSKIQAVMVTEYLGAVANTRKEGSRGDFIPALGKQSRQCDVGNNCCFMSTIDLSNCPAFRQQSHIGTNSTGSVFQLWKPHRESCMNGIVHCSRKSPMSDLMPHERVRCQSGRQVAVRARPFYSPRPYTESGPENYEWFSVGLEKIQAASGSLSYLISLRSTENLEWQ